MCAHTAITPCGIVAYCLNPERELASNGVPLSAEPLEGRRAFNRYLVARTSRLSDIVQADGSVFTQ